MKVLLANIREQSKWQRGEALCLLWQWSLQEAIDFCLDYDDSDLDASKKELSGGEED